MFGGKEAIMPMPELPELARVYSQTPLFTETSVPAALLTRHNTKAGVWGRLDVYAGHLDYVMDEDMPETHRINAGQSAIIAPTRWHHLELEGPVEFRVHFLRLTETSEAYTDAS